MNIWRLLALPGYGLSTTARFSWLALGVLVVVDVVLGSMRAHLDTPLGLLDVAHSWAMVNAALWVFLANTVLLVRDARALRLPELEPEALISLGLYTVLDIALPALLLANDAFDERRRESPR